jgi:peptidyl-prolyl cis-trans isomerase D
VFHVTDIKVPPLESGSEDAKRIDDALRARMADDLVSQYLARLESDIGVTINQSAVDQAVGGGNQNN